MRMMKLNNKAFTLTELLMVILMVGILSAMVLPKFTRVVDSFRVLEAERIMQAVRTDQESRCTLGRKYTMDIGKIRTIDSSNASGATYTTSNFTYTLNGTGMVAVSPKGYTLEMPFYLDGRVCCDQCSNFTKNYVTCSELENDDLQKTKNEDPCKPD